MNLTKQYKFLFLQLIIFLKPIGNSICDNLFIENFCYLSNIVLNFIVSIYNFLNIQKNCIEKQKYLDYLNSIRIKFNIIIENYSKYKLEYNFSYKHITNNFNVIILNVEQNIKSNIEYLSNSINTYYDLINEIKNYYSEIK